MEVSVFTRKKYMTDCCIIVENNNMKGQFEIKMKVVLRLLNSNRMVRYPGPNGIYHILLK